MKQWCRLCWGLSALLALIVAAMGYMFLIRGSTVASEDERTAIALSAGERDLVLGEMRGFLESVQQISAGLAEDDPASVAEAAGKAGMGATAGVPVALMGKLPLEFKRLGLDTHQAFDALAREAKGAGDMRALQARLGTLLLNCTTCHAGYRFITVGTE